MSSFVTIFCISGLKPYKSKFDKDVGKFNFVNRVVDIWNKLPSDIVACETVLAFKIKLDRHLRYCLGFK